MFNFIVLVVMWSFIIIVGFISLNAIYYLFKLIIMTFMDLLSLTFVGKTKYFDYYGYTIRRKRKQGGLNEIMEQKKETKTHDKNEMEICD